MGFTGFVGFIKIVFQLIEGENILDSLMLFIMVLIVGFGYPVIVRLTSLRTMKKYGLMSEAHFFTITSEGVISKSAFNSIFVDWDEFYKAVELYGHFVFIRDDGDVYMIPKQSFNEKEIQFIRDCAVEMTLPPKRENPVKIALYIALFTFALIFIGAIIRQIT